MISYNGNMLADNEGLIEDFKRGIRNRKKEFVENARGDGEQVKFYNKPGCSHSCTFTFLRVPEAGVAAIETRMANYADLQMVTTLSIPSQHFSAANCVIDEVSQDRKEYGIDNINVEDLTYDVVFNITYTVTFRQLI